MENSTFKNLESYLLSSNKAKGYFEKIYNLHNYDLESILIAETSISNSSDETKLFVDYLLDHYGMIFLGTLSGFFPFDFNDEIKDEMVRFLEKEPIREYYRFKKNFFLPEAIGAYCSAVNLNMLKPFYKKSDDAHDYFSEFIILDRTIKHNVDVKAFLQIFHKDVFQYPAEVVKNFASHEVINVVFNETDELYDNELFQTGNSSIGAIYFANFLSQLKELLDRTEHLPVLQSAMWHYYGFYLETKNDELQNFYNVIFESLYKAINDSEWYNTNTTNKSEIERKREMRYQMENIISKTELDIMSMLSVKKYTQPLRIAAKTQQSPAVNFVGVPEPA